MFPIPSYLDGKAPRGLIEVGQPVAQFQIGDHKNFVYLIIDWPSRSAALVDCREELEPVKLSLRQHGLSLATILLTHTHWDHVHGLKPALDENPKAKAHLHPLDRHRIATRFPDDRLIDAGDGMIISLGETRIRALHTPGHSAGELCYLLEGNETHPPFLFTGDTLFVRNCGRTDFPDGSDEQMFASLQRIKELDPRTVILPGHFYAPEPVSTLERELRESPPLRCRSVAELAALP